MPNLKSKGPQWRLVVENASFATDPMEVIYRLCLVDDKRIIQSDAVITHADIGLKGKIDEALSLPVLSLSKQFIETLRID